MGLKPNLSFARLFSSPLEWWKSKGIIEFRRVQHLCSRIIQNIGHPGRPCQFLRYSPDPARAPPASFRQGWSLFWMIRFRVSVTLKKKTLLIELLSLDAFSRDRVHGNGATFSPQEVDVPWLVPEL